MDAEVQQPKRSKSSRSRRDGGRMDSMAHHRYVSSYNHSQDFHDDDELPTAGNTESLAPSTQRGSPRGATAAAAAATATATSPQKHATLPDTQPLDLEGGSPGAEPGAAAAAAATPSERIYQTDDEQAASGEVPLQPGVCLLDLFASAAPAAADPGAAAPAAPHAQLQLFPELYPELCGGGGEGAEAIALPPPVAKPRAGACLLGKLLASAAALPTAAPRTASLAAPAPPACATAGRTAPPAAPSPRGKAKARAAPPAAAPPPKKPRFAGLELTRSAAGPRTDGPRPASAAAAAAPPLAPAPPAAPEAPLAQPSGGLGGLVAMMKQLGEEAAAEAAAAVATAPPRSAAPRFESAADLARRAGQQLAAPNHYALRPLPAAPPPPPPPLALPPGEPPSQLESVGLGDTQPGGASAGAEDDVAPVAARPAPVPRPAMELLKRPPAAAAAAPPPQPQPPQPQPPQPQAQPQAPQAPSGAQQVPRPPPAPLRPLPPVPAAPAAAQQVPQPPPAPSAAPEQHQRQVTPPAAAPPPASGAPAPASGGRPDSAAGAGPSGSANPTALSQYLPSLLCDAMATLGRLGGLRGGMYQWQADCLAIDPGVLDGTRNLVFSAPTSAGKTLVAEVLMLRRLASDPGRKALLVLPLVALCREKAARLAPLLAPLNKEVTEAYGGQHSAAVLGRNAGVVVCTIENANSLVNRILGSGARLQEEFSIVVVDELHMAGEPERGYQLELLLTKLRCEAAAAAELPPPAAAGPAAAATATATTAGTKSGGGGPTAAAVSSAATPAAGARPTALTTTPRSAGGSATAASAAAAAAAAGRGVQILGMSATLPNLGDVARWLGAAQYTTAFRPVPLAQFLKVGAQLKDEALRVARTLPPPAAGDPDHVAFLAAETVAEGHSVLIFCATKRGCVAEAKALARLIQVPVRGGGGGGGGEGEEGREAIAEQLEAAAGAQGAELAALVRRGVGYHNSDLTARARELVEGAYRRGAVCVLCATSTLAAGVNLPARRVIFRQPYIARADCPLTPTRYHQMAGRAGRAGIDACGESILIHSRGCGVGVPALEALLTRTADPVRSCLAEGNPGMRRAMLEVVAARADTAPATPHDVRRYVLSTLLAAMQDAGPVFEGAKAALRWLGEPRGSPGGRGPGGRGEGLILWDPGAEVFRPTALGLAVLGSGMLVEKALMMEADLARAREMFVMTSELHACFLCAPLDDGLPMYDSHWRRLYAVVTQIQSSGGPDFEAMKRIGLQPGLVQARSRGVGAPRGGDSDQDRVCRRFFAARVLQDLIQEVSPEQAAARYELPPRAVEELGRGAARWAATGRAFCERMGWPEMGAVLASFGARVEHGARADVLPLTEIRGVKAGTARLLYDAGLVSPREVAEAAGRDVRRALARGAPFKGRSEAEMMKLIRSQARAIQEEAQKLLRRQAKELMAAAAAGPGGRGRGRGKQRRREEDADSEPTEAEPKRARPAPRQQPAAAPAPAAPPPAAPPPGAPPPPPPPPPGGEPSQPDPDESDLAAAREAEAAARAAASAAAAKAAKAKAAKAAWPSRPGGAGEPGGAFRDAPGLQLASSLAAVQGLAALLRRAQRFGLDFHVVPFERADGALIEAAGMQVPPGPGRRAARKPPPRRDAVDFDADEPPPPPQGTVLGLAVSWAPGRAAYVPLHPAAPPGAAAALAAALADPGVEAVAYGWKQQVAACRWLMAHAPDASTSTSTSAGASPPPPRLPPGMLDARVAAWMAAPDSPYVIDGLMGERTASIPGCNVPQGAHKSPRTPEALLTLISGSPAAGDAACAGLRLRAGGGGGVPGGGVVAARLAALAAALYEAVLPQLEAAGLLRALRSTEMPLVAVLADMEEGGVGLDPGAIRRLAPRLQRRLGEVQRAAHRAAGGSFDIASPKQVSDLLFRRLKLPPPPAAQQVRPRKDGTTYVALSARKEILEALAGAHPVVPLISEFRKLTDTLGFALDLLKRGDVEAGLDAARAAERGGGGGAAGGGGEAGGGEGVLRLRGFYLHTAVSSGRVAMEEPNLQCVPRTHAFVAAPSPEGDGDAGGGGGGGPPERTPGGAHSQFEANLRAAIVPTRDMGPGAAIISADFRQIEFRLMAHFSGDAGLRAMLADGGQDPFASLASTWRGVPLDRVTPDQRNHAKGIVYGLCYGMGSAAMGAKLGVSPKVAARLRAEFLDTFSGVAAWLRSAVEEARAAGFVRTLHGRRRWLPGLSSDDQGARAQAERAAVNSICQGSAADVAKAAMVAIHARLRAELPPGAARLVHQIHDELLVEVRREHVGAAAALVRGCMEGAAALEVPLRARLAAGPSWGEVEELREERVLCPRVSPRR